MPDDKRIEKRAGEAVQNFKDLVFPDDYNPGAKRKVGFLNIATIAFQQLHVVYYFDQYLVNERDKILRFIIVDM